MPRGVSCSLPLLLALGCVRPPPTPAAEPSPPPPHAVTLGCREGLAGRWVLEEDPSWTYDASDDGGTLELSVRRTVDAGYRPRRFRLDAGPDAPRDDGGAAPPPVARITLERTDAGFLGSTWGTARTPSGTPCHVSFHTELLACGDGGLLVRTEPSVELDETCQRRAPEPPSPFAQHRLVRPPPVPRPAR